MPNQNVVPLNEFIKKNMLQIVVFGIGGIIAFVLLRSEVIEITRRIEAVETKQAEYPSQDWFELKFQNVDDKFDDLEKKIEEIR